MCKMILALLLSSSALAVNGYGYHGDHGAPAPYHFEYGVHDGHTGDIKSQYEHSDGKRVHGSYTVKEADGTLRIVKYHSDPHGGFNAVVQKIGHAQHPEHYGHHEGGHGGTGYVGTAHHGDGGYGGYDGGHDSTSYGGTTHHGDGGHGGTSYVGTTHYGHGGDGGYGGHDDDGHGGDGGSHHGGTSYVGSTHYGYGGHGSHGY